MKYHGLICRDHSVRVERVQEISEGDAIAEGIPPGGVRWIGDARGAVSRSVE